MKGLLNYILLALIFITPAYAYSYENIEFYNECSDPCYSSNNFTGLYIGMNAGYSWYQFRLHRPHIAPNLFPLNSTEIKLHEWVPVATLGYDFYPKKKIPARIEVSFSYGDINFTLNPLFAPPFGEGFFSNDGFRQYNSLATAYLDLHTCSRFVPYIGVSGGYILIVTEHDRQIRDIVTGNAVFEHTDHSFSYGGTVGTRFFITNHFVANLQLRVDDLKQIIFENPTDPTLPDKRDYLSNYFHETTVMFGLAYEF